MQKLAECRHDHRNEDGDEQKLKGYCRADLPVVSADKHKTGALLYLMGKSTGRLPMENVHQA